MFGYKLKHSNFALDVDVLSKRGEADKVEHTIATSGMFKLHDNLMVGGKLALNVLP